MIHIGRSYNAARASNDQIIFPACFIAALTFYQIGDDSILVGCTNATGVDSINTPVSYTHLDVYKRQTVPSS